MKNEDKAIAKMCAALGSPHLASSMSQAAWRDVQPVLIRVMRDRALRGQITDLLSDYEEKFGIYGTSKTDQRTLHEFTGHYYAVLPQAYQVPELAPTTPLGLNALLTQVSQDITLSSIRMSEVVSDPTTALALHCASLRKSLLPIPDRKLEPVHLATMHRVLRLQPFDQTKGYMQHFRLFGLCSGGRNTQTGSFNVNSIKEHISIWLDLISRLDCNGYKFNHPEVLISDVGMLETLIQHHNIDRDVVNRHSLDDEFDLFDYFGVTLPKEIESLDQLSSETVAEHGLTKHVNTLKLTEDQILRPLRAKYPSVKFGFDLARKAGLGYYTQICYHVFAKNRSGRRVQLADGGDTDWLTKLLSSKKERMVTSGFGCELIQALFLQPS